jgi:polar amino acid transport system substrate-binding protein
MEPKVLLSTAMLGIGLHKQNADLKTWVDNWVRENLRNGNLNSIYETHHGSPLPESVLSAGK